MNCAVIEKITSQQNTGYHGDALSGSGIGPVKRVLRKGQETSTWSLNSWSGSGTAKTENFAVKDMLPFTPGIT